MDINLIYFLRFPESSGELLLDPNLRLLYTSTYTFSGLEGSLHTGEFPKGVGHRVENGWGLTKVAVVLLNGLIW